MKLKNSPGKINERRKKVLEKLQNKKEPNQKQLKEIKTLESKIDPTARERRTKKKRGNK